MKSDRIAETLADRIVRGILAPGEKLTQDLIAREFGASQVTVREALLRLAGRGLAVSLPRRGMCVAPLDKDAMVEIRAMRHALEPLALLHSAPRLDAAQVEEIARLHQLCDSATSAEEWETANRGFHNALIAACPMPRLTEEVRNLQLLYSREFLARRAARWQPRPDPDHRAILAAVKARDAALASATLKRHLSRQG